MLLGRVQGTISATIKHDSMRRQKLLVIQPLLADRAAPDGDPIVAIDVTGAGKGELVMCSSDGAAVREWLGAKSTPVRWAVIGIADDDS